MIVRENAMTGTGPDYDSECSGIPVTIVPSMSVRQSETRSKTRRSPLHSSDMDDSQSARDVYNNTMEHSALLAEGSNPEFTISPTAKRGSIGGMARHTMGLALLMCVVLSWTLSNFLGSSIFADASYAKPFFLTYLNTSILIFAMLPSLARWIYVQWKNCTLRSELRRMASKQFLDGILQNVNNSILASDPQYADESAAFIKPNDAIHQNLNGAVTPLVNSVQAPEKYLPTIPTGRLAIVFCFLWFGANYFAMACLQYTTVASATILTATCSIWTLLIGALTKTEKFTWRKLCGVLASLAGIVLISHVDLSAPSSNEEDSNQRLNLFKRVLDAFPHKSAAELALGDALALLSAVIYGLYTNALKKSTLKASPLELHMPTFFALVGFFNIILLLPLFPILHFTGIEPFQLPPTRQIWAILIINSFSSFLGDIMWAYAMVFTSPLIVTVGLSLTIPLSLVGEMIVQARYEGWIYWVGAMIVVASFVFIEREEFKEEAEEDRDRERRVTDLAVEESNAGIVAFHSTRGSHSMSTTNTNESLAQLLDNSDEEDDITRDRLQRRADGLDLHDD